MSITECPKCHSSQARRTAAESLVQKLSRKMGFYPWECRLCKARFLLRDRGHAGSAQRGAAAERQAGD